MLLEQSDIRRRAQQHQAPGAELPLVDDAQLLEAAQAMQGALVAEVRALLDLRQAEHVGGLVEAEGLVEDEFPHLEFALFHDGEETPADLQEALGEVGSCKE